MADMSYTNGMGGSTANPPAIPSKYGKWPDAKLRATPPPTPQKPLTSLALPFIVKRTGPASVA